MDYRFLFKYVHGFKVHPKENYGKKLFYLINLIITLHFAYFVILFILWTFCAILHFKISFKIAVYNLIVM